MKLELVLPILLGLGITHSMQAQECALSDSLAYPVAVTSTAVLSDSLWLESVAVAAAYRWVVPSKRRNWHLGWRDVQHRILPPEPRWADDWRPKDRHRAVLMLTLFKDSVRNRLQVSSSSGDRLFDESLKSIIVDPMPGAPALPAPPDSLGVDSVVVEVTVGSVPGREPRGLVRFAAAQTGARLHPGTLEVFPPAGHRGPFPAMTVKYDVTEAGSVDMSSVQFLRSAGASFERSVLRGLQSARFQPPTSNCRPIRQSVVQMFGG